MSPRLILLSLILLTIPIYSMKRKHSNSKIIKQESIKYLSLYIPDIEEIFIKQIADHPLLKKPQKATNLINALSKVNKKFNLAINNSQFNKDLVNMLAAKLYCSHQTIAQQLHTQQANKYLKLQLQLKKLCCTYYQYPPRPITRTKNETKLNNLIAQDVNLKFTYNHKNQQKTALMIAIDYHNGMFKLLVDKANINTSNSYGMTALKYSLTPSIAGLYSIRLIKDPTIIIDQQNQYGETALLRLLIYRQNNPVTDLFLTILTQLLNAGADPEQKMQKRGKTITPLSAAEQLNDERVTDLIKLAIVKKHSNI